MVGWPIPKSIKALRGFLGLIGYYRKFVKDYGKICAPLTTLLKKDTFQWSPATNITFDALKQTMSTTLVLALPNFTQTFIVECDALGTGIGGVLMQSGHPIAFTRKALSRRNLALSTYEKEMLAVVHAVTKWRPYLLGHHFKIRTDQCSLKFLMEQRITTPAQQKWVAKLLGYDYEIIYRRGTKNLAADALSRQFEDMGKLVAISSPQVLWISKSARVVRK
ncbi:hypothetical protein HHK36_023334 [Tetracentron sinense]|uniref:Reverse transcriptase RNase H-like domain-containing protein n=1 Tax=Tetracentron sinense TaxID=13715 RepID=A0A834YL41_TETSI|nr:hypothetical protein HHK36_023334 [Tetracentron sinense]